MKSFIAEDSFWELFPQAAVGVVVVEGMKPTAQIPQEDVDAIAALLDRANIDAERHLTSDTISENAPVKAWREAYRLFKTKKGARCSIENLLKRVLKGKPGGHITPAVAMRSCRLARRRTIRRCPASSPTSMMRVPCAAAGIGATAFERPCPTIRPMRSWRLSV